MTQFNLRNTKLNLVTRLAVYLTKYFVAEEISNFSQKIFN